MTSLLLFYSCCFRPNWLRPIHPQLRREPREKLAPLVLSFLTLFNLQGTHSSSGTFTIISGSVRFVKYFFQVFSNFFVLHFWTSSPSNSLVRIPDIARNVKHFFRFFSFFFSGRTICIVFGTFSCVFFCSYHYNIISLSLHFDSWGDLFAVLENERGRQRLHHS